MIAHLDCSSGISGDKFLSALIDAGFPLEDLHRAVAAAGVDPSRVEVQDVVRGGITAKGLTVVTSGDRGPRHWREIKRMLESAHLPEGVRDSALRAFTLLAEAESHVHGVAIGDVHFHEIGAADTIVDIVGTAQGLASLGIEHLSCSPVAVGSGTVKTAHGTLPIPAPATAELLRGVPVTAGEDESELTTPTGACLVRAFATSFGTLSSMTLDTIGRGAGTRETSMPNVATLLLGDNAPSEQGTGEVVAVLESNIDHLTPEQLAYCSQELLRQGALDVWQTPIVMKKGRSAVALSVMAEPTDASRMASVMLRETGTLGVRMGETRRIIAPRQSIRLETSLGEARFKVSETGGVRRLRPEHDDCAILASRHDLPIDVVAATLAREAAESGR